MDLEGNKINQEKMDNKETNYVVSEGNDNNYVKFDRLYFLTKVETARSQR